MWAFHILAPGAEKRSTQRAGETYFPTRQWELERNVQGESGVVLADEAV